MAPEEFTNKDLDDKLDKILKCVEKSKGTSESADKEVLTENTKALKAIKYARSMDEVIAAGFAYDRKTETVSCEVCEDNFIGGEFHYPIEIGFVFKDSEILPRQFINLKSLLGGISKHRSLQG